MTNYQIPVQLEESLRSKPFQSRTPVDALVLALPEIVVVVEAARRMRERHDCPAYLADALAALDKALSSE